jgi:hypothetical protein
MADDGDALLRRGALGTRKSGKKNGAAAANAEHAHEQAPLLWRGDRGGSDDEDEDEDGDEEQNGLVEDQATGGADGDFDEWEGLPWYRKPSVRPHAAGEGLFPFIRLLLLDLIRD